MFKLCERFHKLPHEIYAMPYGDLVDLLACIEMDNKIAKKNRLKRK